MSSAVSGLSHAVKGGKQNTADVRTQIFGETKQKMQRTSPYEVQYSKVDDITVSDERPKVLRVSRACITCRKRKTKCDNSMPCRTCSQIGAECIYEQPQKRGPKTAPKNVNYVRHLSSSGNSSMYSVTFKSNFGLEHDIASTRLSESMPDAVYWEAIREMPRQETTQPLFSFFFENLWEFLPIIDQITLEEFRRMAQPPKKVLLLLYSLLALSSLIAERVGKSSKHSTELFHNQAKCLFSSLCEQWPTSLEMVQASLLISVFNSENLPSSWMTSGIALRMARALDLPQDINIRNGGLTWMGCQNFDRFIAGCYGRLAATHDSDYDLDFHQANIYNADRQKMLQFYDLFAIYGRILHIANSPRRRVEIYQQLPDLQSLLSKWQQGYVRSSTTTDQFHLFLLSTYHHAAIVLFQTAILFTHSVPHSAQQKYIEALLWSVNELITLYESQTEKLRLIPFSPVHWIQMTVSSLHSITKLEWSRSTDIFNLTSRLKRILEIVSTFSSTTDNQQTHFNYSKLQTLSIRSNHYKLPPVGPKNYTATSGHGHSLPPISTISNAPRFGIDSVTSQLTPQTETPPMGWNKPYAKNNETWDSSTDYADRSEIMGRNTSHHHRVYGDRLDSSYLAHFPRAREQEITHGI